MASAPFSTAALAHSQLPAGASNSGSLCRELWEGLGDGVWDGPVDWLVAWLIDWLCDERFDEPCDEDKAEGRDWGEETMGIRGTTQNRAKV